MSHINGLTKARRISPADYLKQREIPFKLPAKPRSLYAYVAKRDGVRLALDVKLPEGASGRLPAIAIFTPCYRCFALAEGAPAAATKPSPNAGKYRDFFVPRGYALVVVDVRGIGAFFGTRYSFRSSTARRAR